MTWLSVPQAKGLMLQNSSFLAVSNQHAFSSGEYRVQHSYLVVRLPWCRSGPWHQHKIERFTSSVAWHGGSDPWFRFALKTSCVMDPSMGNDLVQLFGVIEMWCKRTTGQRDELIGLVKLPFASIAQAYASSSSVLRGKLINSLVSIIRYPRKGSTFPPHCTRSDIHRTT
ncbi:unnamed protein product [Protopolystoma xenopodis]|uniref:Uncharacterized protein n=1 Tax=Protopolystoma xenopodis TaxID=117903 RepID=A0A448WC86_9PLAT|nr:unnamed protein product [Protopolystoma xenopodis]